MDSSETLTVSAVVVALTSLIKWWGEQVEVLDAKRAPIVLVILSLLGVGLWAFSQPAWARADTFDLFAGWANVLLNSAGVYGFTRATPAAFAQFKPTHPPSGAGSESALTDQPLPRDAERLTEKVRRLGLRDTEILVDRELATREHGGPGRGP